MGFIVSLINEKGGVGKSSLTFSTAWYLAGCGKKVLLVDMDGQKANLTYMADIAKTDDMLSMYDCLAKGADIHTCIMPVRNCEGLFIVPANASMADAMTSVKLSKMKKAMQSVKNEYDYIFIDVSPSPDWKHALTLSCTDYVCIVMLPDVMSLEANAGIVESIEEIQDGVNSGLKVAGLILNEYNGRTNLSKAVKEGAQEMAGALQTKLFDTAIRNTVKMQEAVYYHTGVTQYSPKSGVASDVVRFTEELVQTMV